MKNKKLILVIVILVLGFVFFIGIFYTNKNRDEIPNKDVSWDLLENMESDGVYVNGRVESTDYPYGYNVGLIEDEEVQKAILITPGTSIKVDGKVLEDTTLMVNYEIHPWVADGSDGALLNIVLDSNGKTQEFIYDVGSEIQNQTISLKQYKDQTIQVEAFVTNQEGNNENCDWVILKQFAFAGGNFEEKQAQIADSSYVKSATYFADEWPINFWNSEMDNLDADFRQIKEDGFDSIILVIPWREFQPSMSPIRYNQYAFDKLDIVMKTAAKMDLGVFLRIGYACDYYSNEESGSAERFWRFMGDSTVQEAWYAYLDKMYQTVRTYESFKEGFLTWEDFWGNLNVCSETDENIRIQKAEFMGYHKWIKDNYKIEQYNEKYGTNYTVIDVIPAPQRTEPAMAAMFEFYDDFLNSVLEKSQDKFPNLSMEVRTDFDVIYTKEGNMEYYKHTDTFSCMNSSFITIMYGIPMGFENVGERVSYKEALEKTEYTLQQFKLNSGNKPVYIDQFIFADNTPEFKNNAQIKEDELNDYLENVTDVLLKYSKGYGIWTYRNYCANVVYNSQFALKDKEWNGNENVIFKKDINSMVCKIGIGGRIEQIIPQERLYFNDNEYIFEFEVKDLETPGTMLVTIGELIKTVEVKEKGKVVLNLSSNPPTNISLESKDCCLTIDNIKLYAQVQQGYLYDENNNELQCIEGIRALNSRLQ